VPCSQVGSGRRCLLPCPGRVVRQSGFVRPDTNSPRSTVVGNAADRIELVSPNPLEWAAIRGFRFARNGVRRGGLAARGACRQVQACPVSPSDAVPPCCVATIAFGSCRRAPAATWTWHPRPSRPRPSAVSSRRGSLSRLRPGPSSGGCAAARVQCRFATCRRGLPTFAASSPSRTRSGAVSPPSASFGSDRRRGRSCRLGTGMPDPGEKPFVEIEWCRLAVGSQVHKGLLHMAGHVYRQRGRKRAELRQQAGLGASARPRQGAGTAVPTGTTVPVLGPECQCCHRCPLGARRLRAWCRRSDWAWLIVDREARLTGGSA
jgi:hypothetical protein